MQNDYPCANFGISKKEQICKKIDENQFVGVKC